jgi:hypothetical protein
MTAKVIYFADSRASLLQHAIQVNVFGGISFGPNGDAQDDEMSGRLSFRSS